MIGTLEAKDKNDIIIVVGKKPSWYNAQEMNNDAIGLIYTENSRPKKNDLDFCKFKNVQLIHGNDATDEVFSKWYAEAVNSKPKTLLAVDSELEIYVH